MHSFSQIILAPKSFYLPYSVIYPICQLLTVIYTLFMLKVKSQLIVYLWACYFIARLVSSVTRWVHYSDITCDQIIISDYYQQLVRPWSHHSSGQTTIPVIRYTPLMSLVVRPLDQTSICCGEVMITTQVARKVLHIEITSGSTIVPDQFQDWSGHDNPTRW